MSSSRITRVDDASADINSSSQSAIAFMHRMVMSIQQDANYALIDEYFHPEFKNFTAEAGLPSDRSGVHAMMKYLHASFANIKMHIDHCVSDGRVISTNKTLTGDHVGEFLGAPADGKRKVMRAMDVVTMKEGMIYEHWVCIRPPVEV